MITGRVNFDREPLIQVCVRGPYGDEFTLEAIVDTGFDGWLSLPSSTISTLRLIWRGKGWATLADGGEIVFDTYEGAVRWDD